MRRTALSAIETLQKAFAVKEVSKDTDILSVELKGRDPEQLAKSVNDIAAIYVNATVNWESAEASQKLAFLESQLPVVKERLEKAEQGLSAYRQQHGAVDISAEAEILLKQASDMETLSIQLKQKYDEQSQRLESEHPDMIATNAQIKRVNNKLAALEKRIKDLPKTQQNMVSLSRDVQVNTELYTSLLNSAQEQRIAAAGSLGNSRIVDFAVVPEKPYWPKPGLLLAIATLLGLSLGSALIFLRHSLQRHDNYPALLEYQVGLPMFAAIPHSKKQRKLGRLLGRDKDGGILASQDPLDISVESLRGLRTTLEATLASRESKVIMVSSRRRAWVNPSSAPIWPLCWPASKTGIGDRRRHAQRPPARYLRHRQAARLVRFIGRPRHAGRGHRQPARDRYRSDPARQYGVESGRVAGFGRVGRDLAPVAEFLQPYRDRLAADFGRHRRGHPGQACRRHVSGSQGRALYRAGIGSQRPPLPASRHQPNGFIINDMKQGSSYYPYYGYAYQRADQEPAAAGGWSDKYHAVGDWLSKQLEREWQPAAAESDERG